MNQFSFLNQTTFRIYTYKYKSFVAPCITILICSFLFLTILIPQVQQWFLMQQQIAISEQKLEVLTNNLSLAGKINSSVEDKYLQLVSRALPSDKDFIGVLAAISNTSIDSAISLNDYTFQVGDLSSKTKETLTRLSVTITINGGLQDIRRFATSLKKQFPLSDITDIHLDTNNLSAITIIFYYKPFPEKISFQPAQPLQNLTAHEQSLLQNLISIDGSSKQVPLAVQEKLVQ